MAWREADSREEARKHTARTCRCERDPDVLDTWFSSGSGRFRRSAGPNKTPELKKFYPTSVMETGYDILFFWVARMMMMGMQFMGDVPFRTVYLHGLVATRRARR